MLWCEFGNFIDLDPDPHRRLYQYRLEQKIFLKRFFWRGENIDNEKREIDRQTERHRRKKMSERQGEKERHVDKERDGKKKRVMDIQKYRQTGKQKD